MILELKMWREFRNPNTPLKHWSLLGYLLGGWSPKRCIPAIDVKIVIQISNPATDWRETRNVGVFQHKFTFEVFSGASEESDVVFDWTGKSATMRPCWRYCFSDTETSRSEFRKQIGAALKDAEYIIGKSGYEIDWASVLRAAPQLFQPPPPIIFYAKHRVAINDRVIATTHMNYGDHRLPILEALICTTKIKAEK